MSTSSFLLGTGSALCRGCHALMWLSSSSRCELSPLDFVRLDMSGNSELANVQRYMRFRTGSKILNYCNSDCLLAAFWGSRPSISPSSKMGSPISKPSSVAFVAPKPVLRCVPSNGLAQTIQARGSEGLDGLEIWSWCLLLKIGRKPKQTTTQCPLQCPNVIAYMPISYELTKRVIALIWFRWWSTVLHHAGQFFKSLSFRCLDFLLPANDSLLPFSVDGSNHS